MKKDSKKTDLYKVNKLAKVGDQIECPVCHTRFTKHQWQQTFCSGTCKDRYWNRKGDRHSDPEYHAKYNDAHLERWGHKSMTAGERKHLEAVRLYKTDKAFRDYVDSSDIEHDGAWSEHTCSVDLETLMDTYYGI